MSGMRGWWVASAVLAILVLPGLAGPASGASYSWTLTCKIEGNGDASASWDWLRDGQVIAGASGYASCGASDGGDRPANANGITASLHADAWAPGDSDSVTKSVTRSFDPTESFKLTLKASETASARLCLGGRACVMIHSSVSASFTMTG